ncbi:hypothetical protein CRW58_12505 [Salmonella enterica subsp. enterica serovar Newport]|nr:hypothetical protein [Salmonella enterica subsp. enterica serovar Newport]HED0307563.1 hypothetical protein [Salmonella enterica subsp. enterica serovar Newport]
MAISDLPNRDDLLRLSHGARATYSVVILLSQHSPLSKFFFGVTIFDIIPPSTYYRHRREIINILGIDLNILFDSQKPVRKARFF